MQHVRTHEIFTSEIDLFTDTCHKPAVITCTVCCVVLYIYILMSDIYTS